MSGKAALLLTLATILWAGNAVIGRMVQELISPMTLNLFRWLIAFCVLLPMAGWVLRKDSPLWAQWRRFALLGALSIASYNAMLYLALTTSTAMNVTLVGASTPVWMLLIGRFFFGTPVSARQLLGAGLSIVGVVLVMCRGQWDILVGFHLVAGDVYMLIAAIGWAFYSWMLAHPTAESAPIRADWAAFLLAQTVFGLIGALGSFLTGANGVWPGRRPGLRLAGMDADRCPAGAGLAIGRCAGVYWARACGLVLPRLGCRGGTGRTLGGRVLYEPHPLVCRTAVHDFSRGITATIPRGSLCADCSGHCLVGAQDGAGQN